MHVKEAWPATSNNAVSMLVMIVSILVVIYSRCCNDYVWSAGTKNSRLAALLSKTKSIYSSEGLVYSKCLTRSNNHI